MSDLDLTLCRCCKVASDALNPETGHCRACARGQHTRMCDPAQKAAIAAKAAPVPPKAPAPAKPTTPAQPAKPPPSAQAAAAPAPTPPAPIAPPAAPQDAEPIPVQSLRAEPIPAQALVTAPAEMRGVAAAPARTIEAGAFGLELRSFDDFWRFSNAVAKSGIVKGYETPEKALIALQFGAEVGLSPMQSLQNVATINGRPALHSDAPLAIVRASGMLEDFDEWYEHDGQRVERWPADARPETAAYCLVKRRGDRELVRSFSKADAVTAQLWGKTGQNGQPTPWVTFPGRMMRMRARTFALRDAFGDRLKGLPTRDEVEHYIDVTPASTEVPLPRRASDPKPEPVA